MRQTCDVLATFGLAHSARTARASILKLRESSDTDGEILRHIRPDADPRFMEANLSGRAAIGPTDTKSLGTIPPFGARDQEHPGRNVSQRG